MSKQTAQKKSKDLHLLYTNIWHNKSNIEFTQGGEKKYKLHKYTQTINVFFIILQFNYNVSLLFITKLNLQYCSSTIHSFLSYFPQRINKIQR